MSLNGSVVEPILFNLYIKNIPRTSNTALVVYAHDTTILSTAHHPLTLNKLIQQHVDNLEKWFTKCKLN